MLFKPFHYAVQGIAQAFRSEKNIRVMFVCFLIVLLAGYLFAITPLEWVAVLLCCGGVLALEMINTAVESTVDLITKEHHPLAKKAKDVAAGAVLVWSVFSAAVGLIVFLPHLIALIN